MGVGKLLCVMAALAMPAAMACTVHVPRPLYVHVVRLEGPAFPGLKWVPIHNILDYEGGQSVHVSLLREGRRIPVARWENGLECGFDGSGLDRCAPNRALAGISLEPHFGRWTESADRHGAIRKLSLPLIVTVDGVEVRLWLRGRAVRTTRAIQAERQTRFAAEVCEQLNAEEPPG